MQQGRCPNCGAPATPGQRFCGNCGGQLPVACPYCGTPLSPGFRFCSNCGADMATGMPPRQPQSPPQQQRPAGGQPSWGQQAPDSQAARTQQRQGWTQPAPGWSAQAPVSQSSRTFLLLLLAILLIGLGGLVYWQFGSQIKELFGSTGGSSSSTTANDTTAPVISAITVVVSQNSARVDWETGELASTQVEYGKTDGFELGLTKIADDPTGTASIGVLTHSVVLSGLTPDTEYHYKVRSKDKAGNEAVSDARTFKTEA